MFGLSKRIRRKHRPAIAGMLSASDMERLLAKERVRCDRYEQFFSLVAVHFNSVPEVSRATQEASLARFLVSKLRFIDDFGYLRNGGLGILLPMTDLAGGKVVLGKILDFANQHGLSIEADVFSYQGHVSHSERDFDADDLDDSFSSHSGPLESGHSSGVDHAEASLDSEVLFDNVKSFRDHWNRTDPTSEPLGEANESGKLGLQGGRPVKKELGVELKANIVRADWETQMRSGNAADLLRMCSKPYPFWKRQLDIIGASVGLLAGIPVLIVAGAAVKLTSRGPILFKQSRSGQFGKPFVIYKLRTMSHDAEQTKHLLEDLNERDGPAFKIKNDPRVTMIGRFLRATGIDELPQLINVLKGDMAIVGPRPLPVGEELKCSSWQQRRLDTKPGITCLWQISKSRQMTFDEWMRLDLHYLKKRSVLYDAALLIRTVKAVLMGRVGH